MVYHLEQFRKDCEYQDNWPDDKERCHRCDHYGWGDKAPYCSLLRRGIGALGHCVYWVKLVDISKVSPE
jgi:hypothetical protein